MTLLDWRFKRIPASTDELILELVLVRLVEQTS